VRSSLLARVDGEARRILEESDWRWDQSSQGFRRCARKTESTQSYLQRQQMRPCPDLITFQELEAHHLYSEPSDPPVDHRDRAEVLRWLRSRMESAEPKS
jgi:hypothetical protein